MGKPNQAYRALRCTPGYVLHRSGTGQTNAGPVGYRPSGPATWKAIEYYKSLCACLFVNPYGAIPRLEPVRITPSFE
jgi:hypothetical protein